MAGNETDVLAGLNAFLEGVGSEAARDGAHAGHAHHDHGAHGSSHSTHGGGMEHQGHDMSGHHMMKMWFHGGVDEVILFDFWRTSSCFGLFVSCLAIFVMGAVYEGVKWFRVYLQLQRARQPRGGGRGATGQELLERDPPSNGGAYGPTATPPCHAKRTIERREPRSEGVFSPFRIAEALLYSVQLVLAYWLMLIVMTYNTWLTVAVVAGAGFGHWLFATLNLMTPKSDSQDSFTTDACH